MIERLKENKSLQTDFSKTIISHSQLDMWQSCPHKWKLRYKDKIKISDASMNMTFGTAIHNTLQKFLDLYYNNTSEFKTFDPEDFFEQNLKEVYKKDLQSSGGKNFTTKEEFAEFLQDGKDIIRYIKNNKSKYFKKKDWEYVGYEIPLQILYKNNVSIVLYMDNVFYNKKEDYLLVDDLKTSTKGWSDYDKNDKTKRGQVLGYKYFIAQRYGIEPEKIKSKFTILRRKVDLNPDYPKLNRVQEYEPPSGSRASKEYLNMYDEFVDACFTEKGKIKEQHYEKRPSKHNCKFCPYNGTKHCEGFTE